MLRRVFRFLYGRLGTRYPIAILIAQVQFAHVVGLGGVGLLRLYQRMSDAQFIRILVVAEVLILLENLWAIRLCRRILEPVAAWLDGARDPDRTAAAWRALVSLPAQYVRRHKAGPIFFSLVPVCIYIVVSLKLPAYSLLLLLAGGGVTVLYGFTLRFFGTEMTMRPVLEDVASTLPDDFALEGAGISLRWKLLLGLPVINLITGVVVSGLSQHHTARLSDLGLSVGVAVLVAFTLSLELTLLLTRSILVPLADLERAADRVAVGELDARVPVVSGDEIGRLTRSFNEMVAGLAERERLREAFGAYVAPELAERVARDGISVAGDEVEVTVLFLDIRDFTAFADRASAREVVALLNGFFALSVPVLLRNGGHANKFIGDGLLGVFGAPDRRPDHADRAVAAAGELCTLVDERYGGSLRIGIGINSGPVVAGTVGGGGRVEFTVIGDAVNTAARVERLTRETGDTLLITDATRCLLTRAEEADWEERPPVELRGKRDPVRLWAPLSPTGVPSPALSAERSSG